MPALGLDYGRRLVLFGCIWALCFLISSLLSGFIMYKFPGNAGALRIGAVLQDVIGFITPALATAVMVTRLPATFLGIDSGFRPMSLIWVVLVLLVSIPLMDAIIQLNNSLTLPPALSGLEQWMQQSEHSAQGTINLVLGGKTIGALVVGILLVGVFAGLSEELLFRGALQRLLASKGNVHLAIWGAAFIFSAIHLQFYGFVPRLLLGAFFGYAFYWSRSLWLAVCAHVFNNVLYVVMRWDSLDAATAQTEPAGNDISVLHIIISVYCTAYALYMLRRECHKKFPEFKGEI